MTFLVGKEDWNALLNILRPSEYHAIWYISLMGDDEYLRVLMRESDRISLMEPLEACGLVFKDNSKYYLTEPGKKFVQAIR